MSTGTIPAPRPKRLLLVCSAMHRSPAFDRSFYTILARASDGDIYMPERVVKNPYADRDELLSDIHHGQIENVLVVFVFNPSEFWSRDCSEDIAIELLETYGVTEASREFLEDQLGCELVAKAEREAV